MKSLVTDRLSFQKVSGLATTRSADDVKNMQANAEGMIPYNDLMLYPEIWPDTSLRGKPRHLSQAGGAFVPLPALQPSQATADAGGVSAGLPAQVMLRAGAPATKDAKASLAGIDTSVKPQYQVAGNVPQAKFYPTNGGSLTLSGGGGVGFATNYSLDTNRTLTKAGTGSLTINAGNTYTGGTVVSSGTLALETQDNHFVYALKDRGPAAMPDANALSSGALFQARPTRSDRSIRLDAQRQQAGVSSAAHGVTAFGFVAQDGDAVGHLGQPVDQPDAAVYHRKPPAGNCA